MKTIVFLFGFIATMLTSVSCSSDSIHEELQEQELIENLFNDSDFQKIDKDEFEEDDV